MVTAARDRLARTLRGDVETAFSVGFTASTGDLSLAVEGFGHVRFPVTPAKARKLAHPLPDRYRRTARQPPDQAARPPLDPRPDQDRRALRPGAEGANQG
jgi:hypothetical protein